MNTSLKNTERFSNRVENYVKYRPGYPKELVEYLYSSVGFSKDSIIADIGSGTGIFSRALLELGSRVIGIEPNNGMRKAAERILSDEFVKFISINGTAENTTLSNAEVDYVVCAQAFHWVDRAACRTEFSRILKHNGKVVLVWNNRIVEESGFSAEYEELLKAYANDYNEVNHRRITGKEFKDFFRDGIYDKVVFKNEQLFNFEGLKGRALSSSYVPMPGGQNYDILKSELQGIFDKYNTEGKVAFKYETEAYIGEVQNEDI